MKKVIAVVVFLLSCSLRGATASWTGISVGAFSIDMGGGVVSSDLAGGVTGKDGVRASITGMCFVRNGQDGTYVKMLDYSRVAAPLNTRWLLAIYGDLLDAKTLSSFKSVELCDYSDCGVGGDKMADPSNFYLAFVAENWDDYVSGCDNPHIWYGWVNVGVNSEGALEVFSSGIDLNGGAVRIGGGAIPEPSTALLLLIGCVGLCLRRQG